jgi:3-oxoacyl-[acyl-carrier-protein] synthase I
MTCLYQGQGAPMMLGGDLLEHLQIVIQEALQDRCADALILATTKGDIDRWSNDLLSPTPSGCGSPQWVAHELGRQFHIPAFAVSGACASGPLALGVAARGILSGRWQRVVVIGGDRIGAFIRDGFAALKAIDPVQCRPFDRNRAGLQLGEMTAAMVLEAGTDSPESACFLQGWGASLDGNHLTGPTRDGSGMARALRMAQQMAQPTPNRNQYALIVAHGTGTKYNDDSESLAYATVYPGVPVTGLKGIIGHTLGACGIGEAVLAHTMWHNKSAPGCAHLITQGCAGAISVLPPGQHALLPGAIIGANAGFGGINGVYIIGDHPPRQPNNPAPVIAEQVQLTSEGWHYTHANGSKKQGLWTEPGINGQLPRLNARMVTGQVDASWGRMDLACRAVVTLGRICDSLPELTAIIVASSSGSAESDRQHEIARRAGSVDPQRFAYTLPTTPVGEASIRLQLRGPGMTVHGADESQVLAIAKELFSDGCPAVLVAWIECDIGPHVAHALVLRSPAQAP